MTTEAPEFEIRPMKSEEIPDALDIWRETNLLLGGLNSICTWYEYDPGGFFVAVTKNGKIIGVCAGVLQNEDLAFIGMYAVRSNFRGQGIGQKIWNRVMERIGNRNAGTNPVPEQMENYRDRGGFPIQCNWGSVVFTMHNVCLTKMINELPGVEINFVSSNDVDLINAIAEYDAGVIGFKRSNLFPILCKDKDSVITIARNSVDNSTLGYGIIKQSIKNVALIGPLYADNKSVAELILYYLIKAFPVAIKEGVALMTVDSNQDALDMWEKLGFERHRGCLRLYTHKKVDCNFKNVFVLFNDNFCVF